MLEEMYMRKWKKSFAALLAATMVFAAGLPVFAGDPEPISCNHNAAQKSAGFRPVRKRFPAKVKPLIPAPMTAVAGIRRNQPANLAPMCTGPPVASPKFNNQIVHTRKAVAICRQNRSSAPFRRRQKPAPSKQMAL